MGLVQSAQNSGTGTTLTVTLGAATTAGNCLVVMVAANGSATNGSVSGITLGGSADNFARLGSVVGTSGDAGITACWADPNCAGGQTSVVITQTGGSGTLGLEAAVHERDDLALSGLLDKQSTGGISTGSATWDSTSTATTTQAAEVWFGIALGVTNSGPTLTGPASPWVNGTQITQAYGSFTAAVLVGYQEVSSTGTARYNGTSSPSSDYVALAVALDKLVPPSFAHDAFTLGPAGTDNATTGSYTTTGAQTALSHAASPNARAAVVCITQTGSAADQVSGVTYGGAAMARLRFDSESTEAGATYVYWLDGIAAGTQDVVLTTSGSNIKKMVVSTMTASAGASVAVAGHDTGTSASVSNPSWTISGLTAASKLEAYECIHSGLQTMTTTPAASWTLQESLDEGATGRGFARQSVASSGTTLASGWTAATADDFVGSSVAFIEVPAVAVLPDLVMATRIAP